MTFSFSCLSVLVTHASVARVHHAIWCAEWVLLWTRRQQTHEPRNAQSQNSISVTHYTYLMKLKFRKNINCGFFSDKEWKVIAVLCTPGHSSSFPSSLLPPCTTHSPLWYQHKDSSTDESLQLFVQVIMQEHTK